MGYFIDNMMDTDKIKYKERSICAINGIRQLMSDIQLILSCNTIKGKYYQIAQYIGLATENEKSYYNYFIPINSDIVFLLRFSDHNNTNPSLYNQHERNGRPNKRFIIPFVGNAFQNSGPTPFLGAEHHVVYYPVNALDDEASIKLFLSDLQRLFTNGETNFTQLPQQPIQENNKQINTNKTTKDMKKQTIKLNESQLKNIIKESVKKVLKENIDNPDNLSLRDFMTHYYDNDETCEEALSKLQDGRYVFGRGWEYVFHEGVGDGVYSPQEGIVAVFDEDDLPDYHSVNFYRFNPQAWLVLRDNENDERDWADTEQYDVEPIDESRLNRVIRESIKKILKK